MASPQPAPAAGMHHQDFIGVYEDAVPPRVCAEMVRAFLASGKASRGKTGSGINTRLKDSWDICISDHPEWAQAVNVLNSAVMNGLVHYARAYPHLALAPVMLSRPSGPKAGEPLTAEDVRAMDDRALQALLAQVYRPGTINIQRYLDGVGGYPYWHSEIYPQTGGDDVLHRVLLWTLYLNDGFEEGETEFLYQGYKATPRTGMLLLAPGGFTHTHRGNKAFGSDKFIATSWILFQRAEKLYARPGG